MKKNNIKRRYKMNNNNIDERDCATCVYENYGCNSPCYKCNRLSVRVKENYWRPNAYYYIRRRLENL